MEYNENAFRCSCGKNHSCKTKIIIEENAIEKMTGILVELEIKKVFIVSDIKTYKIAGRDVIKIFNDLKIKCKSYMFRNNNLIPDEENMGKIFINYEEDADIIIGLGSGSINDICKLLAHKIGKPYIIIATAPSMDGYCSKESAVLANGIKNIYESIEPYAVIGDTKILENAPDIMIKAGFGVMLSKATSLCDWKLGNLLTEEYYCDYIVGMMKDSMKECQAFYSKEEGNNEKKSIAVLMETLCVSGIARSFAESSRPSFGSEGQIAYFWELQLSEEKSAQALYGIKLAHTTLIIIKICEKLMSMDINWEKSLEKAEEFSAKEYIKEIRVAFKNPYAVKMIIENEFFINTNTTAYIKKRIYRYKDIWEMIRGIIKEGLISSEKLLEELNDMGMNIDPKAIGIDRTTFISSIIYAKELRNSLTVLQIASDLGLLNEFSKEIADIYY